MKISIMIFLLTISNAFSISLNSKAPNFSLKGHDDKTYSLKDYENNTIVLEWLNHDCPFVKKHYDSNNMQETQKYVKNIKNTHWFSVISSAPGKQGHVTPEQALTNKAKYNSMADAILIDEDGKVGMLYGAKTTPNMFIIHKGNIIYSGAIDSIASAEIRDIKKSENYIKKIIKKIANNEMVKPLKTKPYGCSVKY